MRKSQGAVPRRK